MIVSCPSAGGYNVDLRYQSTGSDSRSSVVQSLTGEKLPVVEPSEAWKNPVATSSRRTRKSKPPSKTAARGHSSSTEFSTLREVMAEQEASSPGSSKEMGRRIEDAFGSEAP
ncbi:hypothetical protein Dimus_031972 [Dionaea muscipula]